jgi:hypothetical protein
MRIQQDQLCRTGLEQAHAHEHTFPAAGAAVPQAETCKHIAPYSGRCKTATTVLQPAIDTQLHFGCADLCHAHGGRLDVRPHCTTLICSRSSSRTHWCRRHRRRSSSSRFFTIMPCHAPGEGLVPNLITVRQLAHWLHIPQATSKGIS